MEYKSHGMELFAGAGGGILAGELIGVRCICAVEFNPYARAVLMARQDDGSLPAFPIWDDVRTFNGRPWRGLVDEVSGGFPCKGISTTGPGTGLAHSESALWAEQLRIIGEVRPRVARIENSPALTKRGGARVIADLAALGYVCRWGIISAGRFGAPHERERMWIVATDANQPQREGGELSQRAIEEYADTWGHAWWQAEPCVCRVDDGMAHRMDRLTAIGNGQSPIVAATAWRLLGGE